MGCAFETTQCRVARIKGSHTILELSQAGYRDSDIIAGFQIDWWISTDSDARRLRFISKLHAKCGLESKDILCPWREHHQE